MLKSGAYGITQCLLVLAACAPLDGAVSDDQAAALACEAVSKLHAEADGKPIPIHLLRAWRDGELEDQFHQLQIDADAYEIDDVSTVRFPVFLYRVTGDGSFLTPKSLLKPGDRAVTTMVTLDGKSEWTVAVARNTGEVFGLAGFEVRNVGEPGQAFNRLIGKLDLNNISQLNARDLAVLYYRLTSDPNATNLLDGWPGVRVRAFEYIHASCSAAQADREVLQWQHYAKEKEDSIRLDVTKDAKNPSLAIVSLPVFDGRWLTGIGHNVLVFIRPIQVTAQGICTPLTDKVLFDYVIKVKSE